MKHRVLFTIGYEGKSIEQYLGELKINQIRALIDIRANPISRKPGFSKQKLNSGCTHIGIDYFHFPDAGIPSYLRKELKFKNDYEELFGWYQSHLEIIPETIEKIIDLLRINSRIALTCFERDVNLCHRKLCAEHIAKKINSELFEYIHL